MNKYFIVVLLALATLAGCTDAKLGKLRAYGNSAEIECYSGAILIYKGKSTGKVYSSRNSDGYYFVDANDMTLKEVSGNCVVSYGG